MICSDFTGMRGCQDNNPSNGCQVTHSIMAIINLYYWVEKNRNFQPHHSNLFHCFSVIVDMAFVWYKYQSETNIHVYNFNNIDIAHFLFHISVLSNLPDFEMYDCFSLS